MKAPKQLKNLIMEIPIENFSLRQLKNKLDVFRANLASLSVLFELVNNILNDLCATLEEIREVEDGNSS